MTVLLDLLVVSPFVLFLILLLIRKTTLLNVSAAAAGLVAVIAIFAWKVYPIYIFGSLIKGILVAFDIFFIIFGAILFLEILKENKIIENISYYLQSISRDLRIQVILLGWFFTNFLEGTAGFGTAATVVVPLLITLGITPLNSVIIGLLGNSAAGVFGAAGTPIKIGFGSLAGPNVAYYAALFNIAGMIVPVFILWFLVKNKKERMREFVEALPFAIWAGAAFSFPSFWSLYFGQEFPSILGSVIGLFLVLITTKFGLFVPRNDSELTEIGRKPSLSLLRVTFPYAVLIVLLVAGKFIIGGAGISLKIPVPHTFAFYNPGFAFITTSVITALILKMKAMRFFSLAKLSLSRTLEPFVVIALMTAFAQIMVNSGKNPANLPSMVNYAAETFKNSLLPVWAPFLGGFGSFLTGSVTVSNLMFGNFLAHAAGDLGISVDKILALAVTGGAAGNMIALADIMTAEAVVGLKNAERSVLKGVILPCLIYILIVASIGLLVI